VDAAIISSVVPRLTRMLSKKIEKQYGVKPVVVKWENIDLKIALKNKGQVGVDRLVNAIAVKRKYGAPAVIIDFGTATTFCALDKNGRYLGGAITSGLAISRDVLHERTAKLPLIEIKKPGHAIGQDTLEAMRSGLFYGYVDMVEGMIKRFKAKLGRSAKVIATGGLSKIIASGTKNIDVVDPDLTLKGLNIIYSDMVKGKR
jgi:type III pantothenate kinase